MDTTGVPPLLCSDRAFCGFAIVLLRQKKKKKPSGHEVGYHLSKPKRRAMMETHPGDDDSCVILLCESIVRGCLSLVQRWPCIKHNRRRSTIAGQSCQTTRRLSRDFKYYVQPLSTAQSETTTHPCRRKTPQRSRHSRTLLRTADPGRPPLLEHPSPRLTSVRSSTSKCTPTLPSTVPISTLRHMSSTVPMSCTTISLGIFRARRCSTKASNTSFRTISTLPSLPP